MKKIVCKKFRSTKCLKWNWFRNGFNGEISVYYVNYITFNSFILINFKFDVEKRIFCLLYFFFAWQLFYKFYGPNFLFWFFLLQISIIRYSMPSFNFCCVFLIIQSTIFHGTSIDRIRHRLMRNSQKFKNGWFQR